MSVNKEQQSLTERLTGEDADIQCPEPTTQGCLLCGKALLAYLKAGCEVHQLGYDQCVLESRLPPVLGSKLPPEYFLVAPNLKWQVRLFPKHVEALEALGLLELDICREASEGARARFISVGNFTLPSLALADN